MTGIPLRELQTYMEAALNAASLQASLSGVDGTGTEQDIEGILVDIDSDGTDEFLLLTDQSTIDGSDVSELLNEPSGGDRRYKVDLEGDNLPNSLDVDVAEMSLSRVDTDLRDVNQSGAGELINVPAAGDRRWKVDLEGSTATVTVTDDGNFDATVSDDGSFNATVSDDGSFTTQSNTLAGVEHGQDSVSTPGTAVALNGGTSLSVPDGAVVTIRAEVAGSGDVVYVGDSAVSSSDGFKLADGEGVSLSVDDVSTISIDADTADDGVSWIVEQ